MESLEGRISEIIFRNELNGWTVCVLEMEEEEATLVGVMPFIIEGEHVKVGGKWTVHPDYGRQLRVEHFNKVLPSTIHSIRQYLSCGIIKGVGPIIAERIVDKFGESTFDVILDNPGRLVEIRGISPARALEIGTIFNEQRELSKIIIFFQQYDISINAASKVYKTHGTESLRIIMENPYILLDLNLNIGFKIIDRIAQDIGCDPNSPDRILGALRYVLNRAANEGHVYVPKSELIDYTSKMLGIGVNITDDNIGRFAESGKLVIDKFGDDIEKVYLDSFYMSECYVAEKLAALAKYKFDVDEGSISDCIKNIENNEGIFLAELQIDAVRKAVSSGLMVITGGPGTGKTTIIKAIISLLERDRKKIALAAPTGRAAKRMSEATGREAKTIHRLLEVGFAQDEDEPFFQKCESSPLDIDTLILDEVSMVDLILMSYLLKAIKPGVRLILVGDADQLPSVGPGSVLKDIISSGMATTVRLTEIFRQDQESDIIINAHLINHGQMPDLTKRNSDFLHINRSRPEDIVDIICRICSVEIPTKYGFDPIRQIQVLSPYKKGLTGIWNLNYKLQETINPRAKGKSEKAAAGYTFRTGDRVMQVRNNYNAKWSRNSLFSLDNGRKEEGIGVFNGDLGVISSICNEEKRMTVIFDDDREVEYAFDELDDIIPAYASTVHKSQGGEFPAIIIPLYLGPPMLMVRNLIYTAVTRAQKLVVTVGRKEVLSGMINNNMQNHRFSALYLRMAERK